MQNHTIEPHPCPDCGHPVYRPLVASVRHPQQTCRAVLPDPEDDLHRCGCASPVHRVPSPTPRHRLTDAAAG